jgi:hypothetical protein
MHSNFAYFENGFVSEKKAVNFLCSSAPLLLCSSAPPLLRSSASKPGQAALKSSRPHRLKRLIANRSVGAALLATCLQAGAASALSFNFSFTGTGTPTSPATVTGIVDGLVDNLNDQTSGLTLTIISATNTPVGGWPVFTDAEFNYGDGFDVSGGQITGVSIGYSVSSIFLSLENQGDPGGSPSLRGFVFPTNFANIDNDSSSSNTLLFTPLATASVPSPLPLFGAAAAFGWSRQLRRRIKTSG